LADRCPFCLRYEGLDAARAAGTRYCPECGADWEAITSDGPLELDADSVVLVAPAPEPAPEPRAHRVVAAPAPVTEPVRRLRPREPRPPAWLVLSAVVGVLAGGLGVGVLVSRLRSAPAPIVEAPPPPPPPTAPPPPPSVAVAPPPPPAPPSASPAGAAARHALDEAVAHLPPGSLADVHIRMDDAVAYLDGTVNSSEAQQQLATAVGSAPGVKAVDARALRVEGRRHVVTLGENLYDLAQRYYGRGDLWTDILKANPGVKPNQMEVGRVLIIPPASHEKRD
jgi:hypothetical protein